MVYLQDPTIAAATNQNNLSNSGLEDYNPFANQPTRNVRFVKLSISEMLVIVHFSGGSLFSNNDGANIGTANCSVKSFEYISEE